MTLKLVTVLSCLDLLHIFSKVFGRTPLSISSFACQTQAAVINFSVFAGTLIPLKHIVVSYKTVATLWNCCMAFNLYRWVVWKENETQLESRLGLFIVVSFGPSLILTLVELIAQKYGDAGYWCWLTESTWQISAMFVWVCVAAVFISTLIYLVRRDIRQRMKERDDLEAQQVTTVVLNKLMLYVVTFVLLWIPAFIDRFLNWVSGYFFYTAMAHTICISLQGFANAVIYGGLIQWLQAPKTQKERLSHISISDQRHRSLKHLEGMHKASLFTTTFNMGEGEVPEELGQWIPAGHDIYVIGVQECMYLDELRAKIQLHLETLHRVAFTQCCREIGRTNTALGYHGHIAITIYVKTSEVQSGAFALPSGAKNQVNRGKSFGLGRASNKGAVGFAFKYYDRSLAVVTCHLTSDSKGQNRVTKRNADTVGILQDLQLDSDHTGFDFPLMHHHSIILGDLNYRMVKQGASPEEIIDAIDSMQPTVPAASAEKYVSLETPKNESWKQLVNNHDELSDCLGRQELFAGFEERTIEFPPTYRRNRNIDLRSNTAQASFCTRVPGAGDRVPSYTDRILYHSLPDMRDYLHCTEYASCEGLVDSDHRPVNGVFSLLVSKTQIVSSREVSPERMCDIDGVAEHKIHLSHVSLDISEPKIRRNRKESPASTNNIRTTCVCNANVMSFSSPNGNRCNRCQMPYYEVREVSELTGRPVALDLVFPLPAEDIFAEQRKVHQLAAHMTAGFRRTGGVVKDINHTTMDWTRVQKSGGASHSVVVRTSPKLHLGLKVRSATEELGQAVVALQEAYENGISPTRFYSRLTFGGQHVGWIQGTITLSVT